MKKSIPWKHIVKLTLKYREMVNVYLMATTCQGLLKACYYSLTKIQASSHFSISFSSHQG